MVGSDPRDPSQLSSEVSRSSDHTDDLVSVVTEVGDIVVRVIGPSRAIRR